MDPCSDPTFPLGFSTAKLNLCVRMLIIVIYFYISSTGSSEDPDITEILLKVALNTITQTTRRSFFIFLMVAYVRPIELQGLYPRISGTSICTIVIYTSQWYCTINVATLQLFIPYRIFFYKDLNFFIFGTILSHSPLEDQLHLYKSESLLQNDHLYFWFHFCRTVLQEKIKCRKVYTDNGWTTIM